MAIYMYYIIDAHDQVEDSPTLDVTVIVQCNWRNQVHKEVWDFAGVAQPLVQTHYMG